MLLKEAARLRASSWMIFVIMWLCGKTHSRLEWWMLVIINKRYESISCGKQVTTVVHLPVFQLFLATLMHQSGVEMLIWYHRPGSEEDHNVNAVKRSLSLKVITVVSAQEVIWTKQWTKDWEEEFSCDALLKKKPVRSGLHSRLFMLRPVSCVLQITGNNFNQESHI